MKVSVQSLGGGAGGDIELNDAVFGLEPRADILHRVVTWQLEKRRGTARGTRERADVARSGKKLGNQDWVEKSGKMLNLALAAPMDRGACPTTYRSREKAWTGSIIAPDPKCYYDLTNMAWNWPKNTKSMAS